MTRVTQTLIEHLVSKMEQKKSIFTGTETIYVVEKLDDKYSIVGFTDFWRDIYFKLCETGDDKKDFMNWHQLDGDRFRTARDAKRIADSFSFNIKYVESPFRG